MKSVEKFRSQLIDIRHKPPKSPLHFFAFRKKLSVLCTICRGCLLHDSRSNDQCSKNI